MKLICNMHHSKWPKVQPSTCWVWSTWAHLTTMSVQVVDTTRKDCRLKKWKQFSSFDDHLLMNSIITLTWFSIINHCRIAHFWFFVSFAMLIIYRTKASIYFWQRELTKIHLVMLIIELFSFLCNVMISWKFDCLRILDSCLATRLYQY